MRALAVLSASSIAPSSESETAVSLITGRQLDTVADGRGVLAEGGDGAGELPVPFTAKARHLVRLDQERVEVRVPDDRVDVATADDYPSDQEALGPPVLRSGPWRLHS
jgi:hypothetical protein